MTIFILLFAANALAQQGDNLQGQIEIWNGKAIFGPVTAIPFSLDAQGIQMSLTDDALTDIVISTSCGDIIFEGEIDGSDASRFQEGMLLTELECEKITIVRATGKLAGMTINLLGNLYISEEKPIPLELLNSQTK
jgi:hypothetical protein